LYANPVCVQIAIGTISVANPSIVNNCDGILTITMTDSNTQNIQYSYTVQDDLGATSSACIVH